MAGITGVAAIDVTAALATGNGAVVTARTNAQDLAMVDGVGCHRCPGGGEHGMAGIAKVGGINVTAVFTAGGVAIVTGDAVT